MFRQTVRFCAREVFPSDSCLIRRVCVRCAPIWSVLFLHLYTFQVCTFDDGCKQGIDQQIFITQKNLLIDFLLTPIVESAYLNRDMCKFESWQKDESRWQSTDSSKAYRNTSAFKCIYISYHLGIGVNASKARFPALLPKCRSRAACATQLP